MTPSTTATYVDIVEPLGQGYAIAVLSQSPTKFALRGTRTLPAAGGSVVTDSVQVSSGTITAKLSEIAAKAGAAVMTATPFSITLGALAPGRYRVEIQRRSGASGAYQPAGTVIIEARDSSSAAIVFAQDGRD